MVLSINHPWRKDMCRGKNKEADTWCWIPQIHTCYFYAPGTGPENTAINTFLLSWKMYSISKFIKRSLASDPHSNLPILPVSVSETNHPEMCKQLHLPVSRRKWKRQKVCTNGESRTGEGHLPKQRRRREIWLWLNDGVVGWATHTKGCCWASVWQTQEKAIGSHMEAC